MKFIPGVYKEFPVMLELEYPVLITGNTHLVLITGNTHLVLITGNTHLAGYSRYILCITNIHVCGFCFLCITGTAETILKW